MSLPLVGVLFARHFPLQVACALAPLLVGGVLGYLHPILVEQRAALLPLVKAFQKMGLLQPELALLLDPSSGLSFALPLLHPLTLGAIAIGAGIIPLALPAGARTSGVLHLLLATPLSRSSLVLSTCLSLLPGMILLGFAPLLGVHIAVWIAAPDNILPWGDFARLSAVGVLLGLSLAAIALLISTMAEQRGRAIAIYAAVLTVFFVCELGGRMNAKIEWLTRLSPFGWYPVSRLLAGKQDTVIYDALVLLGLIALLLVLSLWRAETRRSA